MANHVDARPLPASPQRTLFGTIWGAVATTACVGLTALLAPVAAILATVGKLHAVTEVSRFWARSLIRMCGVKVEIENLDELRRLKSYVVVCNHQSFFDIFAVAAYMPGEIRFVAKQELLKIPVLGYALRKSEHVIVHRQAGGRQIRNAIEIIHKGFNLCVFAEGHRHNDNQVHEFSDGAAWLAILAGVPAVPMAISGSGAFFPRLARVVVPGGTMRMTIGSAIPTAGLKSDDRAALTRKLEDAVRAMFVEEVA
jgi:1-acyl-sn-glycerol-3-phosphate acyltransferase